MKERIKKIQQWKKKADENKQTKKQTNKNQKKREEKRCFS